MITSLIIIGILIIASVVVGVYYYKKLDDSGEQKEEEEPTITSLVDYCDDYFDSLLRENLRDQNLDQRAYLDKQKIISRLETNINDSKSGSAKAKRAIKAHIKDLLTDIVAYPEDYIPFDKPERMTPSQKFHTMLFLYNKVYDGHGFSEMMDHYDFSREITYKGEKCHKVTKAMVNEAYDDFVEKGVTKMEAGEETIYFLDKNDMMDILVQDVFSKKWGWGEIDDLYSSDVDEIDGGTSGVAYGGTSVKSENSNIPYSYEAIWITYHGLTIQLECLSFGTEAEFERICENVYKFDPPYVLSQNNAKIVATTENGSRITVSRPPFSNGYKFWLRKFDTVQSIAPDKLIGQKKAIMLRKMIYWSFLARRTMGVTGAQNTGKTTLLKSISKYIPTTYNVRTNELQFEASYSYAYPYRNIAEFQATPTISEQDGLDFQKKTNGGINIIGEVANARQAAFVIQTSGIASYFTLFTSHHETTKKLVEGFGDNLLSLGLANGKTEAYSSCAQSLNMDCHLVFEPKKQFRHAERLTEIIPTDLGLAYPSETAEFAKANLTDKEKADAMEYYRRATDPKTFDTVNIIEWDEKNQEFKFVNEPSERFNASLRALISDEEYQEYLSDIEIFKKLSKAKTQKEIEALESQIREI